jgi:SAM-dependent methyltransferase
MSVQYENAVSPVKARFISPALDGCGSMCDVGIGAAPNLQYISPSEQLHVIGVDSNPAMLERASARIAPAQLQLDCRQGDVTSSLRLLVPQVKPLGERVFVKVAPAEEQTQGGILLPGDAQQKPTSGSL